MGRSAGKHAFSTPRVPRPDIGVGAGSTPHSARHPSGSEYVRSSLGGRVWPVRVEHGHYLSSQPGPDDIKNGTSL